MRTLLKSVLVNDSNTYKLLRRWYRWYKNYWMFDVLYSYVTSKNDIHFLQIGSHDGKHGDPIFNYVTKLGLTGILVEPVPYLFEKLKSNYNGFHGNLFFENSAIAKQSGKLLFYRLRESNLPDLSEWYDQLGSFKKDVVLKHRYVIPHFDDLYIEDTVNAITFDELINKHRIEKLNLIVVDTEGYDYEILNMIPLNEFEVDLIMFEHRHLSGIEYKKALELLKNAGFKVQKKDNGDTIAIKKHWLDAFNSHHRS